MRAGCALAAALFALFATPCQAAEQRAGRVAHVIDGGSLEMLTEGKRVRVRLAGVAAPAPNEPFGLRSRQSLVQLCSGEMATVTLDGRDPNGRALGRVVCAGTDAGAEQVRRGFARTVPREGSVVELAAIEDEARAAHRGLWSTQPALSPSAK